jgi:hypothetical protein
MKKLVAALLLLCGSAFGQTVISNVYVQSSTATTATIVWTTSTPATSLVLYGYNISLPYSSNINRTLTTSHSVTVTNLSAAQPYYFAVSSIDGSNNTTQSSTYQFALCGTPQVPVSGTINPFYYSGPFTMTFNPPSGSSGPYTVCGQPVTSTVTGNLNLAGGLAAQVADALKVTPGPGTWTVAIQDAGNIAPISVTLALSAQTQDISPQLQSAAAGTSLVGVIANNNSRTVYPSWISGGSGITQLTGDAIAGPGSGSQSITFNTVSSTSGQCGDSTHVCQVTTNAKGLTTAQTAVAISASGSVANQTASYYGLATNATTIGATGNLDDGVTTGSVITAHEPFTALGTINTTNFLNTTNGLQVGSTLAFNQGNTNTGTGSHNAFTTCGSSAAGSDTHGWADIDCGYQAGAFRAYGDQSTTVGTLANRYNSGITGVSLTAVLTGTALTSITINNGGSGGVHNACYQLEINGSETFSGAANACTNSSGVITSTNIVSAGNFGSPPTLTVSIAGGQNAVFGYGAGGALNSAGTDYDSTYLGYEVAAYVGSSVSGACTSYQNTGVGHLALGAQSGPVCITRATAMGDAAAQYVTTGGSFVALGRSALQNATNIVLSVGVGHAAAYGVTSSTADVLIGDEVAYSTLISGGDNLITGISNTFVGEESGITTGSSGVANFRGAFGWGALSGADYSINIGATAAASAVLGHNFLVGIDNSTPAYTLDVAGTFNASGLSTFTGGANFPGTTAPLELNGSAGTSGQALISGGSSTTPSWGNIPQRLYKITAPVPNTGNTTNNQVITAALISAGTVDATGKVDVDIWFSACTASAAPYASCTAANTGTCTFRTYLATTSGGQTTSIGGAIATPAAHGGRYTISLQAQNSTTSEQVDVLAINSTAISPVYQGLSSFNLGTTALYFNVYAQNSASADYCVIDQMNINYQP